MFKCVQHVLFIYFHCLPTKPSHKNLPLHLHPGLEGLEGGDWISNHGLNFRTFSNHVTLWSHFTNHVKR